MTKTTRMVLAAVAASLYLATPTSVAARGLESRDIDADGEVDAFYDPSLHLTWLRQTTPLLLSWSQATDWANQSWFGLTGWRLPSAENRDGTGVCVGFQCQQSEMGHLWYVELGNNGLMTNRGDFQGLVPYGYWTATPNPNERDAVWYFNTFNGTQFDGSRYDVMHAFAVRDGDVSAVPEDSTRVLAAVGLVGIITAAKRRRTATQDGQRTAACRLGD
jgi:hypothetical protein